MSFDVHITYKGQPSQKGEGFATMTEAEVWALRKLEELGVGPLKEGENPEDGYTYEILPSAYVEEKVQVILSTRMVDKVVHFSFRKGGPLGPELVSFEFSAADADDFAGQIMDCVQQIRR